MNPYVLAILALIGLLVLLPLVVFQCVKFAVYGALLGRHRFDNDRAQGRLESHVDKRQT